MRGSSPRIKSSKSVDGQRNPPNTSVTLHGGPRITLRSSALRNHVWGQTRVPRLYEARHSLPARLRMNRRPLGRSGISIAPLMLGGNVFGWTIDEATSFAILDAFVDA